MFEVSYTVFTNYLVKFTKYSVPKKFGDLKCLILVLPAVGKCWKTPKTEIFVLSIVFWFRQPQVLYMHAVTAN
jgi:hypothetical protein